MTLLLALAAAIACAMLVAFAWFGLWWLRYRRLLFSALLEQGVREERHQRDHGLAYHQHTRLHAIQQRLARHIGKKRAFSKQVERDIVNLMGA